MAVPQDGQSAPAVIGPGVATGPVSLTPWLPLSASWGWHVFPITQDNLIYLFILLSANALCISSLLLFTALRMLLATHAASRLNSPSFFFFIATLFLIQEHAANISFSLAFTSCLCALYLIHAFNSSVISMSFVQMQFRHHRRALLNCRISENDTVWG